jgi:hypothetical protein
VLCSHFSFVPSSASEFFTDVFLQSKQPGKSETSLYEDPLKVQLDVQDVLEAAGSRTAAPETY